MIVFHKIKTLHLKPTQREVSTQITEEDRHLIYPGKRKLLDMKFLTSTPKKSKLELTEPSINIFDEDDSSVERFPKMEPRCNEDIEDQTNLVMRFNCPICVEHSNSCRKMLFHIETVHAGGEQDVRPVKQNMRIMLGKVKMTKQKLSSQVNYYKKYGGLYLHTGVKGNYQCVLKSVDNIKDIDNIRTVFDRNNIHIQDYSDFAFESLKDFNNKEDPKEDDCIFSGDESEVSLTILKFIYKIPYSLR